MRASLLSPLCHKQKAIVLQVVLLPCNHFHSRGSTERNQKIPESPHHIRKLTKQRSRWTSIASSRGMTVHLPLPLESVCVCALLVKSIRDLSIGPFSHGGLRAPSYLYITLGSSCLRQSTLLVFILVTNSEWVHVIWVLLKTHRSLGLPRNKNM